MSTRSTTHFINSSHEYGGPVIVYRHSDGYPSGAGADIQEFFKAVEAQTTDTRFNEASYLAAKYVVYLAGSFAEMAATDWTTGKIGTVKPLNFLSVGVMDADPMDIEYRYTVDTGKMDSNGLPTVTVQECFWGEKPDGEHVPLAIAISIDQQAFETTATE